MNSSLNDILIISVEVLAVLLLVSGGLLLFFAKRDQKAAENTQKNLSELEELLNRLCQSQNENLNYSLLMQVKSLIQKIENESTGLILSSSLLTSTLQKSRKFLAEVRHDHPNHHYGIFARIEIIAIWNGSYDLHRKFCVIQEIRKQTQQSFANRLCILGA
ncbi:MAG TPA: hypothetical protein VN457_06200 [Chlamydiales bacterium]|nr:hypothetical protein [Chlamydiales bacterium]